MFMKSGSIPMAFDGIVIGGGPAGLSCAYFLLLKGYSVDIFEAEEKAGGMLRFGIPAYRLPKDVLDKEIEKSEDKLIEAQRIAERTNFDIEMLRETGFCSGIENYSMHVDGRTPDQRPYNLFDYFDALASITKQDILNQLSVFTAEKAVLSVVNPIEKGGN